MCCGWMLICVGVCFCGWCVVVDGCGGGVVVWLWCVWLDVGEWGVVWGFNVLVLVVNYGGVVCGCYVGGGGLYYLVVDWKFDGKFGSVGD